MALSLQKRVGFSAAIFLSLLLALEVVGRLLPSPEPTLGLPTHPTRGWTLPVSASFVAGDVTATTNHLGLRSPEPQDDPEVRILSLGDSSVFGDGVEDDETFSAVLAERTGVDVQNGGVPGYTCAQSTGRYEELVDVLKPDILLVYSLHNDVRVIQDNEAWLGAVDHPIGLVRLASSAATWLRIKRKLSRLSVEEYRACLVGLVAAQAARGGKTMLITPISRADFDTSRDPRDRAVSGVYLKALDAAAAETGAPLLDLLTLRWCRKCSVDRMMIDEVHPSARGHSAIGRWLHAGLITSGFMEGELPDLPRPGRSNTPFPGEQKIRSRPAD